MLATCLSSRHTEVCLQAGLVQTSHQINWQHLYSFDGAVEWRFLNELPSYPEVDICFQEMSKEEILVSLPSVTNPSAWHHVLVAVDIENPVLSLHTTLHTLLAPSFSPGIVGIDWEDVRLILCSGEKGHLVTSDNVSNEAISTTCRDLQHRLEPPLASVMGVLFLPQNDSFMDAYSKLAPFLRSIVNERTHILFGSPRINEAFLTWSTLVITPSGKD